MPDDSTALLLVGMNALVPLWIREVDHWSASERREAAIAAGDLISCGADGIWNANLRRRDIPRGKVSTAMAKGLAVLAYGPGGVDWAGGHWCVASHRGCPLRKREVAP